MYGNLASLCFAEDRRLGGRGDLNVVSARTHPRSFVENADLLTAPAGRGFGVEDAKLVRG